MIDLTACLASSFLCNKPDGVDDQSFTVNQCQIEHIAIELILSQHTFVALSYFTTRYWAALVVLSALKSGAAGRYRAIPPLKYE
uniref:Uncharacterized protein n=1 Tax=Romanomermis culicivorax TaxID=13658 RepID=A0A915HW11_ROMCU